MMRTRHWLIVVLLAAGVYDARAAAAVAEDPAKAALAKDVLAVFTERCAECHGPKAVGKEKKYKYTYVLDLPRLAANPKYLTPGDPAKSLLYVQLEKNEMPPPDDADPITPEQRETVRKWILAGCPTGVRATTTTAPVASAGTTATRPSRPLMTRLVIFLGKFHPLAAHTPIAVLMAAAIAEMLYLRHPAPALTGAARFCCVLGALGAIATAALGWAMASGLPTMSPEDAQQLELHRWVGTIAGIASIPIAILGEWGAWRAHKEGRKWHGVSRWMFRIAVFGIAGLVGFTAHLGGLLVWGKDLFNFPS